MRGSCRIVRLFAAPRLEREETRQTERMDIIRPIRSCKTTMQPLVTQEAARLFSRLTGTALPSSVRADDIRPSKAARRCTEFFRR